MKLKQFIKKLQNIEKEKGGEFQVVMADDIPVVNPVFSTKYSGSKIIITDIKPSN